jgi:hypothetical protein
VSTETACEQCGRTTGTVEQATQDAIDELAAGSPLNGVERALAQSALVLARAMDADEGDSRQLAGLTRELRATLKQLADSMPVVDDDAEDNSGPA